MLPISDQRAATRTLTEADNAQAFMARDMAAQAVWLGLRAKAAGFADLDDLVGKAPAMFTRLAAAWRQAHPMSAMA